MEFGMVTDVMFPQPSNARLPIVWVPSPISTILRELHESNAFCPMVRTEPGIVTEVRVLHELKALFPIVWIELGMVMEFNELHSLNVSPEMDVIPPPKDTEVSPEHFWNAPSPMDVTELGILI